MLFLPSPQRRGRGLRAPGPGPGSKGGFGLGDRGGPRRGRIGPLSAISPRLLCSLLTLAARSTAAVPRDVVPGGEIGNPVVDLLSPWPQPTTPRGPLARLPKWRCNPVVGPPSWLRGALSLLRYRSRGQCSCNICPFSDASAAVSKITHAQL